MMKRLALFFRFLNPFFRIYLGLLKDPRVPFRTKIPAFLAIAYVLSPIDLLPGVFLPFLGWAEDLLIFYLSMRLLVKTSPRDVVAEHVRRIGRGS